MFFYPQPTEYYYLPIVIYIQEEKSYTVRKLIEQIVKIALKNKLLDAIF